MGIQHDDKLSIMLNCVKNAVMKKVLKKHLTGEREYLGEWIMSSIYIATLAVIPLGTSHLL